MKVFRGKGGIFDAFGINKQIETQAFGRQVSLPSGASLVIEKTEAMHVVDVNSGSRKEGRRTRGRTPWNRHQAAQEIARLLRLRDMGGIIAVDFIDLYSAENRRALLEPSKEAMADDKAKHNILPPSRFGVIRLTRQRVRPERRCDTSETCPTCGGGGSAGAHPGDATRSSALNYVFTDKGMTRVTLCVHPRPT